ncbi:MAG: hypothetical protein HONBIEJF_00788 [Fimbriimonadaceae bacterium]|nr:hypothetical protein [Fimbriimonadaceae bacterium]
MAAFFLLSGQSLAHRQPTEVSRLRPGELLRVFRRGGHTPQGLYQGLVVVYWDGKAIVKRMTSATTIQLSDAEMAQVRRALRSYDATLMDRLPKATYPPSAADGLDIYLSVRKNGKVHRWTNVEHQMPERSDLLELVGDFETSAWDRARENASLPPKPSFFGAAFS